MATGKSVAGFEDRPITAGIVSQMASDATAAFTGDATSHITAAQNARAISVSRFSNFEEKERAVKKYPFPAFYIKGFQAGDEDVEY